MSTQEIVLVTGGAGFIGSHLCGVLLEKGYQVICIDNMITGSKTNIEPFLSQKGFSFLTHDVTHPLPQDIQARYVFHLASPASVIDYQKYPEETALVNTQGTRNMLQFCQERNARFLFASTSEIYGDPLTHPQTETYWGNVNPVGVRACYDESKRWGEMITSLYHREKKLDTRIIRIFNTYGPNMRPDDGRVISNFINQALKSQPITVYGSGKQTRSFCYVSDLVAGIVSVMFEGTNGEIYNLGNPEEYTMNDLAQKIISMTGTASTITYLPLPEDDPEKRRPDITKIQTALGWKPKVSVDEGLTKTIAYYQSLRP